MQKAKPARPPPDNPAQSERFMKDAAELMSADGAQLFERAMETLAKPTELPVKAGKPIIQPSKVAKKKAARASKKSGSAE